MGKNKSERNDKTIREEFIRQVKEELITARNNANKKGYMSFKKLANEIKDTYSFEIDSRTLQNLFMNNEKANTNLDYACLVTVCRYYGLDLNKLLKPRAINKEEKYRDSASPEFRVIENLKEIDNDGWFYADEPFLRSMLPARENFVILKDEGYINTFYGYRASEEPSKNKVFKFKLEIKKDGNDIYKAEMITYLFKKKKGSNEYEQINESYHGVPVLDKKCRVILLFLVNDKTGEFCQLSFPYEIYGEKFNLICSQGVMLSAEKNKDGIIRTQNVWLFNKDLPKEKYKYLRGLLRVPNHSFCVTKDAAEELARKNEIVNKFIEKLNIGQEQMYIINEDHLRYGTSAIMDKDDILKALLLLKEKSKLQTAFHYKIKDNRYRGFAISELAEIEFGSDEEMDKDD